MLVGAVLKVTSSQDEVDVVNDLVGGDDWAIRLVTAAELVESAKELNNKLYSARIDVGIDHVEEQCRLSNQVHWLYIVRLIAHVILYITDHHHIG